MVSKHVGV